jgi:hypothetical protein
MPLVKNRLRWDLLDYCSYCFLKSNYNAGTGKQRIGFASFLRLTEQGSILGKLA